MSQQLYPRVIAEIGCNHKGEMAIARDLIESAARFAKADFYHVRPLSPAGSEINIHGTIKVTLKNVFLLGAGSSETTKFQIRIKDRMQHWSNTLETKTISITK